VTKLQEEKMGRNQIRLGVWALAILTCFAIFGDHTAYAWQHETQPRVMAGGQYFMNDPTNTPGGSDRISFGINGRCESGTTCTSTGVTFLGNCDALGNCTPITIPANGQNPKGTFEYFNHFSKLKTHGKITDIVFRTLQASDTCPNLAQNLNLVGAPSAIVKGSCNDGSCSFQLEVVDGDDRGISPNPGDWVCNVQVSSTSTSHSGSDSDTASQLVRGDIEIRTSGR
jgi:hypothetical protein